MAIAIKCDICGSYFDFSSKIHNYIKMCVLNPENGAFIPGIKVKMYDACPSCIESIKNHIESLKDGKKDE